MARCQGVKANNAPCERIVSEGVVYCFSHDPSKAEQRRANASKAGKVGGVNHEIREVKGQLREWMGAVAEGRKDRGNISIAAQVAGVLVRYLELERRIKETEQLEARIEELEARYSQRQGGLGQGAGYGA